MLGRERSVQVAHNLKTLMMAVEDMAGIEVENQQVSNLSEIQICFIRKKSLIILSIKQLKLTTTNMYFARARCESQPAVKSSGLNARSSKGRAVKFKFLA